MDFVRREELIKLIEKWAIENKIDKKTTVEENLIKTAGEISNLIAGISEDNINKIKESVGGVFISLVIGNLNDIHINFVNFIYQRYTIPLYENLDKIYMIGKLINNMNNIFQIDYRYVGEKNAPKVYWSEDIESFMICLGIICKEYGLDLNECIEYAFDKLKK